MNTTRLAVPLLALLFAQACGGAGRGESTLPEVSADGIADAGELGVALRAFYLREPGDEVRDALRRQILAYYARSTDERIASGEYDALVEHLGSMVALYTPAELQSGPLSAELEAPARHVVEAGSHKGDEGRVLAALLLLSRLHPDDAAYQNRYDQLASWGRDARTELGTDYERFSQLIDIWDVHSLLSPAPAVLETLAQLHIDRRDAAVQAFQDPRAMMGMSGPPPQQIAALAPLDVAGVFLRHGELATAIRRVEQMGASGPNLRTFIATLETAQQDDAEGAEAALQIAEFYREARPEVARGMCLSARRRFPEDGSFAACLARVAGDRGQFALAASWYAEAIERDPDSRDTYDEALTRLNDFIAEGVFDSDPTEARALAKDAERILEQRSQRWPNITAPVPPERFLFLLGVLEMSSGHPDDAAARFEASIERAPSPDALMALGQVLERTGKPAAAVTRYRAALDLVPSATAAKPARAELLEHMGDAYEAAGDAEQASRMYREALLLWDEIRTLVRSEQQTAAAAEAGVELGGGGLIDARRGVLLDKLERGADARQAFGTALAASGNSREVFATILSYLVAADPAPELAARVYRESLRQLSLEPEWKVYFGLWVRLVAARASRPDEAAVADPVFEEVAASETWPGQLARFSAGQLAYEELLSRASGLGERTEAMFYEGARRLSEGDRAGARSMFDAVLDTGMVSFFEYVMAQKLLAAAPATQGGATTP